MEINWTKVGIGVIVLLLLGLIAYTIGWSIGSDLGTDLWQYAKYGKYARLR